MISLPPIGGVPAMRFKLGMLRAYMVDHTPTNLILELLNHPPRSGEMIHVTGNLHYFLGGFWKRTSNDAYIELVVA